MKHRIRSDVDVDDMKSSLGKAEKMTRPFVIVHRAEEAECSQHLVEGQVCLDSKLADPGLIRLVRAHSP